MTDLEHDGSKGLSIQILHVSIAPSTPTTDCRCVFWRGILGRNDRDGNALNRGATESDLSSEARAQASIAWKW